MNPVHLQTFLAVQKHLNYTRGAKELLLSQPAVSRQIHQLERELGLPLFEQIGKSLHLTDAGRTLAREAEQLLGSLERVAEVVRAHRSAERGRLWIGASTTPGFYLLPPVLGRFHERYPHVELRYTVENSRRIEQKLLRNELDLGFVGACPSNVYLRAEPVIEDEIVCFTSASNRLAKCRQIDPKSLERETWVIREKGAATRELFESWLTSIGAGVGRTIELSCPEAVKALVAAGIGFSYMSVHGLQVKTASAHFKKLNVSGLHLIRTIYLVRHVDKHSSPVMEAFLELVRNVFGRREAVSQ
ncbi:MAG TPA: LysR substrate-binding domain-containing protein [Thermoguttaceae bacterium]